jgi:hypothetical protein
VLAHQHVLAALGAAHSLEVRDLRGSSTAAHTLSRSPAIALPISMPA